ncbi:MAG: hypothetical protein ABIS67_09865, partial [Candidatus Eisenbacteria bacterium]
MTRIVAILAVAGGVAGLLFYLHLLGKGPLATLEARHLRAMKDRGATPEAIEPITYTEFFALPRGLTVAEYSGLERRAVSLEGQVRNLLRATDGDYHAELHPLPDLPPARDSSAAPVPPPAPPAPLETRTITTEITPQWHGNGAGGWSFERLAAIFRPEQGLVARWESGPSRVRLSGWLLYDDADDAL